MVSSNDTIMAEPDSASSSKQTTAEKALAESTEKQQQQQPGTASVDSGPVQAYAKLEGEEYCYYIRTLQVTMGRQMTRANTVDIPLGNAKSVSRQHARLFYNFATQRFEIMVFGKNGAFINEQFIERGVTVPLENRTKIQIGETAFLFLLPRVNHPTSTSGSSTRGGNNDSTGYISTPQLEKSNSLSRLADVDDDPSVYATNKDIKPPYSYAHLIAQAINSTEDKRMALHEIYNYITTHFPYYQMAQNGWQNSIRHNLSLNKAFVKVPRGDAEPGKGAFWTIDPKADVQLLTGNFNKRTNKRPSSSKGSPAENGSPGAESPQRKRSKKDTSDNEEEDSTSSKIQGQHSHSPMSSTSPQPAGSGTAQPSTSNNTTIAVTADKPVPSITTTATAAPNNNIKNNNSNNMSTVTTSSSSSQPMTISTSINNNNSSGSTTTSNTTTTPVTSNVHSASSTIKTSVTATTTSNPTTPIIPATTKKSSSPIPPQPATPNATAQQTAPASPAGAQQQNIQAQIQLQLQATIRQHLLDPMRYPLPPSIAQLLPQAIAQLPPHLANQFSATLQTALRAHNNNNNNASSTTSSTTAATTANTSSSSTGSKSATPPMTAVNTTTQSSTTSLSSSSAPKQQSTSSSPTSSSK